MPDTATEPVLAPTNDTWTQQLAQLKARYKHMRQPVLVALNILLHDQNVALDDAKAQANLHGVRITAASMNAARTLLSRMDDAPMAAPIAKPRADTDSAPARPARRPRPTEIPLDLEALVRGVVTKVQTSGNAEAERLREVMRKAIALLQAAVG